MKLGNCTDMSCGFCSMCLNKYLKILKPLLVDTGKVSVTKQQKDKIDLLVASYMMFAATNDSDGGIKLKELDNKWESMFTVLEEK